MKGDNNMKSLNEKLEKLEVNEGDVLIIKSRRTINNELVLLSIPVKVIMTGTGEMGLDLESVCDVENSILYDKYKNLQVIKATEMCPFCREDKKLKAVNVGANDAPLYQVVCQRCGARGPEAGAKEEAVSLWNQA